MKYNTLGNSELKISSIGFGCMSLLKAETSELNTLTNQAIDAGINYFDTADLYDNGENEKLIGQLLKPVRSKVILATKVGNEWKKDGSGWSWNPRKSYILNAVNESLKRLQTDYIDVYQLHGGTIDDPIEETIEAFEELVQKGKIRYYGMSSIRPNVIKKYVGLSNIKSVMMQYSLLDRRPEEEMLNYLNKNKISVLARGVLAKGLLVDKPASEYLDYCAADISNVQQLLQQSTTHTAFTKTSIALQYVLNNHATTSAVIGFRSISQLQDVLTAIENRLPDTLLNELKTQIPTKIYTEHRD